MHATIQDILPDLIKIRKQLHQNPELGLQEIKTTTSLVKFITDRTNAKIHKINPTGLLAEFDSGISGANILIRGDIDALPIQEINTFDHQSQTKGVSHKCGHDGHATALLGLAYLLTVHPIKRGKVSLIFQPSEENGKGAEALIADPYFQTLNFDFVFALHNLPGFKLNEIVLKENNFNANVKTLIIDIKGKTAHAAEPEKGRNPTLAIAEIIQYCDQITHNKPADQNFFLITPAFTKIGQKSYGISPGFGTLHLTIRSWDLALFNSKIEALQNKVYHICKNHGLTVEYSWTEVFYANINDKSAVGHIRNAAIASGSKINELKTPFKWGEDFGLFTQRFKGAMFGIGAGLESPALHNPDYDFPDEILPTSINIFYLIIQNTNNK
jgi:amidohydrolase